MGLNVKDLVNNRVYYTCENNGNNNRIFRFECFRSNTLRYKSRIVVSTDGLDTPYRKNDTINNSEMFSNIREATQDETEWLEACEKAGKFVDKPVKKEFIVGKWYKYDNDYYIKYKETILSEDKTYNKVYGEIIKYKEYIGIDYFANRQYEAKLLNSKPLEDLSEIQQYLPDNHVDKVKTIGFKPEELVEGCWYIVETKSYSPLKGLFKFKKIHNKSILYEGKYYNYCCNSQLSNNPNGFCSIDNIKRIKQASNEEVLKYFPDEKFDNKWIPQVGDWVVVKSYNQGGDGNGIRTDNLICQLCKKGINLATGIILEEADFSVKEGLSFYNIKLEHIIRKATNSEIPITKVSSQENFKAKSILDDLDDYGCEAVEMEVEVTFKTKEVSKSKKTRLQLYEEITPIKVEEVVKLTVKSKINKNK